MRNALHRLPFRSKRLGIVLVIAVISALVVSGSVVAQADEPDGEWCNPQFQGQWSPQQIAWCQAHQGWFDQHHHHDFQHPYPYPNPNPGQIPCILGSPIYPGCLNYGQNPYFQGYTQPVYVPQVVQPSYQEISQSFNSGNMVIGQSAAFSQACAPGWRVTGGGAMTTNGTGWHLVLTSSNPSNDGTTWMVSVTNLGDGSPTASNATTTVYAICSNGTTTTPGY